MLLWFPVSVCETSVIPTVLIMTYQTRTKALFFQNICFDLKLMKVKCNNN